MSSFAKNANDVYHNGAESNVARDIFAKQQGLRSVFCESQRVGCGLALVHDHISISYGGPQRRTMQDKVHEGIG